MKSIRKVADRICMILIVLLVITGLYFECPNLQMTFATDTKTEQTVTLDLSGQIVDATELYTEEVGSFRTASIVARKIASVVQSRKLQRLPVDLSVPIILSERIPYYIEMDQRLAELPVKQGGLVLRYIHEKDGKKRI